MDDREVDREEVSVVGMGIISDDPHVLALARICGARLVYTEDRDLMRDLKDRKLLNPLGKVLTTGTPVHGACALLDRYSS